MFIKNLTVNVKVIQEYNCLKFAKSNLSRILMQCFSCNKLNKTTINLKNKLYKYECAAYYNWYKPGILSLKKSNNGMLFQRLTVTIPYQIIVCSTCY